MFPTQGSNPSLLSIVSPALAGRLLLLASPERPSASCVAQPRKKKKNSLETMPSEIPEALYPFSHYTVHHHSGNYMSSQLCYKDSSGWGSGFICVSFILCVQLLSHVRLFATPWTVVYQSPPGKNTGVGCHFLLQGSSWPKDWTHVSLCLLHWQADSFPLALPGKPYPRYILKNP